MIDFLQTALTFPTLIYSIVLAFCVVYWLLSAVGLLDIDALDGVFDGDGDASDTSVTTGLLARVGLSGVPLMIVLSVLAFFGWLATYFVQLLVLRHLPDGLRLIAGIGTLVAALVPGVLVTSLLLRPVSRLMLKLRPPVPPSILGRAGSVISPRVTAVDGRAEFDDGGAGLNLQVRAMPDVEFQRGDRVVLLSHDERNNTYTVISETEFNRR